MLRISALSGKGVNRLWPQLQEAVGDYRTRIPTRDVNKCLRAAQSAQPAPTGARVLYATQGATDPPTFTLFVNRELPKTYLRYLERLCGKDSISAPPRSSSGSASATTDPVAAPLPLILPFPRGGLPR